MDIHNKAEMDEILKVLENEEFEISEVKKGERITLVGFGTFSVNERNARNGRNPRTGAKIKIAAKKVVRFKAGAELNKLVK